MTKIYLVNIIGPISTVNDQMVSYNKYPIVCVSNNGVPEIFSNDKLKESLSKTIADMDSGFIQDSLVHIRSISNDLTVDDTDIPLRELLDMWMPKKTIQSPVKKSTPKPVRILGNVNGHI